MICLHMNFACDPVQFYDILLMTLKQNYLKNETAIIYIITLTNRQILVYVNIYLDSDADQYCKYILLLIYLTYLLEVYTLCVLSNELFSPLRLNCF